MSKLRVASVRRLGALVFLLAGVVPVFAATAPADPSALDSELMPRAGNTLLLDAAHVASGWVVVGERGHVLTSRDGKTWNQAHVPTRSTLTTITAVGDQLWAAGHDGVIIHSSDAGKSWSAQRRDPYVLPAGQQSADHDPRQGAPILDILFYDASHGIAVGAHSLMLVTQDGGVTWTAKEAVSAPAARAPATPMQGDVFSAADLQLDEESDPHLNAIVRSQSGALVVVGERGTLLRSTNDGANWTRLGFPYKGSMFGLLALGGDRLLAFGLRGNVYESTDLGSSWNKVSAQGSASLMGGTALANGGVVLTGVNGTVLSRATAQAPFVASTFKNANGETPALAAIAGSGNDFVLVGDKGVNLFHLP